MTPSTGDTPGASRDSWQPHLKEQTQARERVRRGLESWMRERLGDRGARIVGMRTPSGTGVANETLLFELARTTGSSSTTTEGFVARLAAPDPLYLDDDLFVHYRMYETLMEFPSIPTPRVVGYEADPARVGAPFFVMEKIEGEIPTDTPLWSAEGFVARAKPAQRRELWERTVRLLAELHRLPSQRFEFLRSGTTGSGTGDCLDYWMRSLRWAGPAEPIPLVQECEAWLRAAVPDHTALSWGDSRLPNVIYRDFAPVGLLDWDLVSLAGPQADLAWWILMDPTGSEPLDGIGTAADLVALWEECTGQQATDLRWYLAFGAYRMAAIFAKLFSLMVARGQMTPEAARAFLAGGQHVQWIAGLLELSPPPGVAPRVPDVRL